jgi:hypothetical protein
MANAYKVVPSALVFAKVVVRGPIADLYPTPETKSFVFTNNSGASVTITDWGFSNTTEGDAVTQPNGIYKETDFTVVPNATTFPVTVANSGTKQFDVTYAPIRRGSGFGDIRSALIVLFAGNKALGNGGQVLNTSGEVIDNQVSKLLIVGVGGGVIEEGFNWPQTHPIMGLPPNFSIADIDSGRHSVSAIELFSDAGAGGGSSAAPVNVGARAVQVLVQGLDVSMSLDLIIQVNTSAGLKTVATYTGLNYTNVGGLFIGNQGGARQQDGAAINLQGLQLSATVSSVTNTHSKKYSISVVVTG